jgi:murein DD-endopeptidase MepM/ murein hydrolase activator NlpD
MRNDKQARIRALVGLVALVGLLAGSLPAAADPRSRLETLQAKKARVEARRETKALQRQEVSGVIAVLDRKRAEVEDRVSVLDADIDRLDSRISETKADLTAAQQQMLLVTDDLQDVLSDLEARTEIFNERAVAAYIAGPTAYIDSLLSAESVNDLVDRQMHHEAALDSDADLVDGIEDLRDKTTAQREIIEARQAEIVSAKRRLDADKLEIAQVRQEQAIVLAQREEVLGQKQAVLEGVKQDEARLAQVASQLEADSDRIRDILAAQEAAAAAAANSGGAPAPTFSGGALLWPAPGPLTSPYGYRTHPIFGDRRLHTGIDIGAGYGAAVIAADAGIVSYAGAMSGYGNVVVVDHGGGIATTYNHMSAFSVSTGQSVGRGEQVGAIGCTGYCTGPHLHFEVRANGYPVDPMPYLQ